MFNRTLHLFEKKLTEALIITSLANTKIGFRSLFSKRLGRMNILFLSGQVYVLN